MPVNTVSITSEPDLHGALPHRPPLKKSHRDLKSRKEISPRRNTNQNHKNLSSGSSLLVNKSLISGDKWGVKRLREHAIQSNEVDLNMGSRTSDGFNVQYSRISDR